jgi:two-component system sensor histidine kinase BaeS
VVFLLALIVLAMIGLGSVLGSGLAGFGALFLLPILLLKVGFVLMLFGMIGRRFRAGPPSRDWGNPGWVGRSRPRPEAPRRRLLADLGHELRTPLTVVRGEIEAMLDGVHEIDADHLNLLMNEVMVMERLLEDLRTLSLIDAGKLEPHREPTDLAGLIEDVADGYRRRAGEQSVTVSVAADGDLEELLLDAVRIREVLTNLAINALRAMPDGGRLQFRLLPSGAGAVIEVTDSGTGIDAADLEHVFDRFHRGSNSGGSGLGLTISRDLVEANGGTMTLESQPGAGTTVRVELPNGGGRPR